MSNPGNFNKEGDEIKNQVTDSTFEEKKTQLQNEEVVLSPPEGGLRAWSQVLAGHLIVAVAWGLPSSFGVFQTHYEQTLPQTASNISWIGGVQVFTILFVSTLSGRATDAGYARLVVAIGSVIALIGTFTSSFATEYWQIFLSQGLCCGLGFGLIWLPSITIITHYFAKKRVLAVTIAATGTSTGGIIFPLMIQHLTPKIGFPWAVRCMGFVAMFMLIIVNLLLRTRLPPRKSGPLVEWGAFREPAYVLFATGIFLLYWALYFALFYIELYAKDKLGFSEKDAGNLIIIINAIGFLTRAPNGYIADRYLGPLNIFIPWVTLLGILMFCWTAVTDAAGLYAFAVFFGLFSSAAMGLFAGTVPSLTKDITKIGTRVGMILTLMSLGPLTGPPLAGKLIAATGGGYLAPQVWAGSAMLVSAGCLLAARLCISGWNLRVKM